MLLCQYDFKESLGKLQRHPDHDHVNLGTKWKDMIYFMAVYVQIASLGAHLSAAARAVKGDMSMMACQIATWKAHAW